MGDAVRTLRGWIAVFALLIPSLVPLAAEHTAAAATTVPRLTVGDLSVVEPDAGKIIAKLPVDLDRAAPTKLYVAYKVTGGSATPRTDFASPKTGVRTGTVAIPAGRTDAFVSITVKGDTALEPDDTVNVDITGVTGGTVAIARSHGTLTIQNNDAGVAAAAVTPTLSVGTPVIWEGNTSTRRASVPVTLSVPAPAPITVTFTTPGSGDTSSYDSCNDLNTATVASVTKTLTFDTNQQSKSVLVKVRGNVAVGPVLRATPDSSTVKSGTATEGQSSSSIVVVDDDTSNAPSEPPPGTYRVSEPLDGSDPTFPPAVADPSIGCGYPSSHGPVVSADGRFVAFSSNADNLVANDTNGYTDTFVKDTWTGDIQRVSVAADGSQGNGDSYAESISGDGRYVTFMSFADDLVSGDDNQWYDSFVADRATGDLERLGDVHTYHQGARDASISADGRYVAFEANATLTGGCACVSVYLLDRSTDAISLVSTGPNGQLSGAGWPKISGDGHHVAFLSNGQAYVKDLDSGTLEMVSVNNAGQPGTGIYGTYSLQRPALSYDGQVVAFSGQYCNFGLPSLICGDGSASHIFEIWVRDRTAHTTDLASLTPNGTTPANDARSPSMSSDGRYVAFQTSDMAFAADCSWTGGDAGGKHMYVRDRTAASTARVDVISSTVPCPVTSFSNTEGALNDDGSIVTYTSMLQTGDVSTTNPEAVYLTRLR